MSIYRQPFLRYGFLPLCSPLHHQLLCSIHGVGYKVCYEPRRPIRPALISGFCSMKRLGVFLSPPSSPWIGCQPIAGLTPSIRFAGTHLYTWVERGTVRVKCLAQEHNTMSPARIRTRTTRSGVDNTDHEATAPPMAWDSS